MVGSLLLCLVGLRVLVAAERSLLVVSRVILCDTSYDLLFESHLGLFALSVIALDIVYSLCLHSLRKRRIVNDQAVLLENDCNLLIAIVETTQRDR